MLKDVTGRELKVDDLVCVSSAEYGGSNIKMIFGRVLKLTPQTFEYMALHDHTSRIYPAGGADSRRIQSGDIFRCKTSERAMIVNGVDDVEHLFVNEAEVREAGFQRYKDGK